MKISVEGKSYDYDGSRLMLSEAKEIQAATGQTMLQWQRGLTELNAESVGALVWLLRRRAGETNLAYMDVEFDLGSFEYVEDDEVPTPDAATPEST